MAKPQKKSPNGYKPIDMSKYEDLDGEWRKIGLSAPARKALVEAKLIGSRIFGKLASIN